MLQTGINTVILSAAAAVAGKLDDPCSHRSKLIFFRSFVLLSGQQIRIKPYHFKLILRTEHDCSFSHFVWWRVQLVSSVHRRIWSHQQLLDAGYRLQDFPTYKTKIGNLTENPQPKCLSIRHAAVQDSWHKTHDAPECFQFLHHWTWQSVRAEIGNGGFMFWVQPPPMDGGRRGVTGFCI